jgi:Leucine-rich repeat (LRR) protein
MFHSGINIVRDTGNTRLELEEDLFLRWNLTSLISLGLPRKNITEIRHRAFYNLPHLLFLDLSGNRITTLHSQTFYYNTQLIWAESVREQYYRLTSVNISGKRQAK